MPILIPYAGAERVRRRKPAARVRTKKKPARKYLRPGRPPGIFAQLPKALKESGGQVTALVVISAVADTAKLRVSDILGRRMETRIVRARLCAYTLCKDVAGLSHYAITNVFRKANHSTVADGIKSYREQVNADPTARQTMELALDALRSVGCYRKDGDRA